MTGLVHAGISKAAFHTGRYVVLTWLGTATGASTLSRLHGAFERRRRRMRSCKSYRDR
jgi:hypothetical protein